MSGTTSTETAAPASPVEPTWAKPSVSVYAMTLFLVALAIAYYAKDQTSLSMMMGATIAMAQQVVNYWMGSSSGSARKTEMQAPPPGTVTTVVAPPAPSGTATTSTTTSTPASPTAATGATGATA